MCKAHTMSRQGVALTSTHRWRPQADLLWNPAPDTMTCSIATEIARSDLFLAASSVTTACNT